MSAACTAATTATTTTSSSSHSNPSTSHRHRRKLAPSRTSLLSTSFPTTLLLLLFTLLSFPSPIHAIKFELQASHHPTQKCIWNYAHSHALIIITANVSPGRQQRVDVEVRDRNEERGNVYLNKRDIKAETRLAVTAHADGDVGVCFKNTLDASAKSIPSLHTRVVDLDVDIGADAVDYNAIANLDGLSALEVEMRKLEGVVKEIVDELGYLKQREETFSGTNESTNVRVQNFAVLTIVALIGIGVWQIFHLRAFFRRKYLID